MSNLQALVSTKFQDSLLLLMGDINLEPGQHGAVRDGKRMVHKQRIVSNNELLRLSRT